MTSTGDGRGPTTDADRDVDADLDADLDLEQLLREIDDEVRHRRASGDFPPGLERDLDLIFARFAPATTSGDDLDALLESADKAAFVDIDVPTASRLPGVPHVKRVLRKLMAWYLRYLAQQVSTFATSVVAALRLLGRRVESLEAATPGASPRVRDEASRVEVVVDTAPFDTIITELLTGVTGRVLLAEAGDGRLLRLLVDAGLDAYGVDHRQELVDAAAVAGLEVRPDDVLDHLRQIDDEALAAVVLAGCVDRLPLGEQVELAERAAAVLKPDGRIVVVGTTPAAWNHVVDPIASDLAPGRPLHPVTWAHLLERRGFSAVETHPGPAVAALDRVAGEGADVLNRNLARIEEALFGPASFAVTGTRA